MEDAIQNIRLAYRALLQNDSQLSHLRKKLADGDLAVLQKYSMRAGQLAVNALKESAGNESIDQTSVKEALDSVFRENYDAVANASTAAQKAHNEASGIGLNASVSDYSDENVQALADRVISHEDLSEGISSITNDIVVQSQRYADDSERRSAEFENDSGLEVLVTREYDDVGVHTTDKGGGDVCQWCLDRCGEDVPYEEAYRRGMFERHPGCGCIITYKTKKGILRQGKGDWQDNSWSEVPNSVRDKRISFSYGDRQSLDRWKVKDVKSEYLKTLTPGVGTIKADDKFKHDERPDEINCSKLLANFGGNIVLRGERDDVDGVKSADYWWDGQLWDLKTPTGDGKRTIDNQFSKINDQIKEAPGGMIMDCSKLTFSDVYIVDHTAKRMNLNHFDGDVIIKRDNKIIDILRNK